jgi:hypothetical protein
MPDENNTEDMNETATIAAEDVPKVKKTRQARKPKVPAETTSSDDMAASEKPVRKTRAKRGSKTVVAKPSKATARTSVVSTAASDTSTETAAPAVEFDDGFADPIKLEEENRNLRKQLSEKLRAENADLRKRLGQN